jgi:peptidyl-prolyl cis-trans isomerase B (cyclophilin B)
MDTSKGRMVFGFYHEEAPGHARNIAKLAQEGFYNGLGFHRIIKGFMIQSGCPNSREGANGQPGTGGPGYSIDAEFSTLPHERGVLSMARSQDPNSGGSQFFVVHAEHASSLDGQYTVFAYMKDGLDVLDAIASVDVAFGAGGEKSNPTERVEITEMSVEVVEPETEPESEDEVSQDGPEVEQV